MAEQTQSQQPPGVSGRKWGTGENPDPDFLRDRGVIEVGREGVDAGSYRASVWGTKVFPLLFPSLVPLPDFPSLPVS